MRTTIGIFLMMLLFGNVSAQTDDLNNGKYHFAKHVFEQNYSKKHFKRFKGKIIVVNNNSIKFDEKTLVIYGLNPEYKSIFTSGIFYPNIITGNRRAIIKSKKEIESMTKGERVIYNMTRSDSIKITYFDQLKALNPNAKIRRFIFWQQDIDTMNPNECYFELENENATEKTSLSEFIENAKLTFYYKGTIII
jgi:hypothetical protein